MYCSLGRKKEEGRRKTQTTRGNRKRLTVHGIGAAPLGVSADEILGLKTLKARNGGVQNRRLLRQVQALEKLPKRDQQAVIRTIEAFLAKAG
jgi:hypothetical protein